MEVSNQTVLCFRKTKRRQTAKFGFGTQLSQIDFLQAPTTSSWFETLTLVALDASVSGSAWTVTGDRVAHLVAMDTGRAPQRTLPPPVTSGTGWKKAIHNVCSNVFTRCTVAQGKSTIPNKRDFGHTRQKQRDMLRCGCVFDTHAVHSSAGPIRGSTGTVPTRGHTCRCAHTHTSVRIPPRTARLRTGCRSASLKVYQHTSMKAMDKDVFCAPQ